MKGLKVLPAILFFVLAVYNCADFSDIGMQALSYSLLGFCLLSFVISCYFIVKQGSVTLFDMLSFGFMITIVISSLMHGNGFKESLYAMSGIMLICFMFNFYQHNLTPLLVGMLAGFSSIIYIQLVQCIIHPEMWLLEDTKDLSGYVLGGNYNQMGCRLLCGLVTNIICLRVSKWFWLNMALLTVSSIALLVMVHSITSLVCLVLFLAICMLPSTFLVKFSGLSILVVVALFQILICFNGVGLENSSIAEWLLVDVFGKDVTFTNRTEMWKSAIDIIRKSPLLGNGFVDNEWYLSNMSSFAIGPHNIIFSLLIFGGVVSLSLFTLAMVTAVKTIINDNGRTSSVVLVALASLFMMMLMESYPLFFVIYLAALAYYSPQ